MSPLLSAALGSIIRWLLAGAAGYLVSKGVWSNDAAQIYVQAATLGALSLAWSIYQKWKAHQLDLNWLHFTRSPSPQELSELGQAAAKVIVPEIPNQLRQMGVITADSAPTSSPRPSQSSDPATLRKDS